MDSIITEHKVVTFRPYHDVTTIRYYAYILLGSYNTRIILSLGASSSLSIVRYLQMQETIYIHSASSIYLNRIK